MSVVPRFVRIARRARWKPLRRALGLRPRAIGKPLRRALTNTLRGPFARGGDELLVDRSRALLTRRQLLRQQLRTRPRRLSEQAQRAGAALRSLRASRGASAPRLRRRRRGGGLAAMLLGGGGVGYGVARARDK